MGVILLWLDQDSFCDCAWRLITAETVALLVASFIHER